VIRTILAAALAFATPAAAETVDGSRIVIVDGDTISLPGGERIRLLDIDAPESFRSACEAELVAGLKAKERVRALLTGQEVTIERNGRDRYRRTLGRLFTEDGDIGEILLSERLALPYVPGRKAEREAHWCGAKR
jgi:endonuclease YncB( thermonuclease family)